VAHPYSQHRQTAKEHSRVGHIVKGYKSGGAVKKIGEKSLALHKEEHREIHAEGDGAKHRMDRPKRAKGGKVKGRNNSKTVINVITGHPGGAAAPPPMAPPGIGAAAMPPPAPPPMAMKPPMPPPGGPPPGMPMRARGGKVQKPAGTGVAAESSTAKDNKGSPVFNASLRNGTKVSHTDGKSDLGDMNRREVITFASGGKVKSFTCRAKGGRIESPQGVAKATMLPGGGGGGEARLVKAHREARKG
jgi:hypothetical protein